MVNIRQNPQRTPLPAAAARRVAGELMNEVFD